MTYLDAAERVLSIAGEALHYREITDRALHLQLISPQGLTPEATMGSRLYSDTKQDGSRFVREGKGRFGLARWQPAGIDAEVQKINKRTRTHLRRMLATMPPDRFEALIGELLIQMGFDESTVQVTKRSSDGGIDVTGCYRAAGLTELNAAVQVKRWKANVQAPVVTQLRGSLQVQQQGMIITTSDFSKGARAEAVAPGKVHIGLINGKDLLDLLVKHQVGVVEKTLTVVSLDDEWWGELSGEQEEARPAVARTPEPDDKPSQPPTPVGPAGRKPSGFTLLGEVYVASSWRETLLEVCRVLAQEHGEAFAQRAFTVRGRTRQHVAPSLDGMISPTAIPGTNLWLEANQSARSALQVIERLLKTLGHSASDFEVILD